MLSCRADSKPILLFEFCFVIYWIGLLKFGEKKQNILATLFSCLTNRPSECGRTIRSHNTQLCDGPPSASICRVHHLGLVGCFGTMGMPKLIPQVFSGVEVRTAGHFILTTPNYF